MWMGSLFLENEEEAKNFLATRKVLIPGIQLNKDILAKAKIVRVIFA